MRDGSRLSFEDLREAAAEAVAASDQTQTDVADALGVHRSSISRALAEPGANWQQLQRRIIAHLTPYQIDRKTYFKARRVEP